MKIGRTEIATTVRPATGFEELCAVLAERYGEAVVVSVLLEVISAIKTPGVLGQFFEDVLADPGLFIRACMLRAENP